MQTSRYKQLDFSEEFTEFFDDFELEKISKGTSLLEFFQMKGIIFQSKLIESYPADHPIETLRPRLFIIKMIMFILVAPIVAAIGYVLGFITAEKEVWKWVLFIGGILVCIILIIMGLNRGITKLSIYQDKIYFRELFGTKTVFWNEIIGFSTTTTTTTTRQKRYILCCMVGYKTTSEDSNYTMHFVTTSGPKSIDLNLYGVQHAKNISKRIIEYAQAFIHSGSIFNNSRKKSNMLISQAEKLAETYTGKAFEVGVSALTMDDGNPGAWKFVALLISSIIPEESFPFIEKALNFMPSDPDLWNAKGLAFEQLDGNENALEAYSKAIAIDSKHTFAHNNILRLTGKTPISTTQPIQFLVSNNVVQSTKELAPREIKVKIKEIKQIEKMIGDQTSISVSHLMRLTGMYKYKIIKIATEHLNFILEGDVLEKDTETQTREQKVKVERIEHIIGGRKEVPLDYLEIVTKLPQDEIIAIVKELGYRILDNKVIR